jgi:hypothetical protein
MLSSPNDRSACDVCQPDDCHPSRGPKRISLLGSSNRGGRREHSPHQQPHFRRLDLVWFDLNDHLLADIGETRAEAEAEAARCVWRTPLGTMADRVIPQDLAKPRLPSNRF